MKTLQRDQAQPVGHDAGALIWEAKRRQRRRRLAAGLTVVALLVTAVVAVAGHRANGPHRPAATARADSRAAPPRPLLAGVNAAAVMWPSGGPELWMSGGYVDDLGTGHIALRGLPGIYGCDCYPYLISTGQRVVYVAWGGVAALPAGLTGKPRWLGSGGFFAPAAAPGHIWKITPGHLDHPSVRLVAVTGGRPGPALTLPRGTWLRAGTDAGLVLDAPAGRGLAPGRQGARDLELWRPGAAPRTLPHSAGGDWAVADARLVVYGTGCRQELTARQASLVGHVSYDICSTLRVFNAVTGKLTSFEAPAGTAGWRLRYLFGDVTSLSPADTMIAAYAKLPALRQGRVRLYVLTLTGPRHRVRAVPSSAQGLLGATMAWTPDSSWLLYQGPGEHLWAYQPATGKVRSSRTPCCQYIGMLTFPTRPG